MNLSRNLRPSYGVSLALALILLAHAFYDRWQFAVQTPTIDFFTFWSVPHAMSVMPVANIYAADSQQEMASVLMKEAGSLRDDDNEKTAALTTAQLYNNRVDATGSPFLYTMIAWISSGQYSVDQKRFVMLSFFSLIVAVAIMVWLLRFSVVEGVLALTVMVYCNAPLIADNAVGNTNAVQLLLITLFAALMVTSKPFLAGVALGTGVMLKPNIGVIVLLSVLVWLADRDVRRQLQTAAGMIAAALVGLAVSTLYFGNANIWFQFGRSLPRTLATAYPLENGNFGLTTLIGHLSGVDVPSSVVFALLLVAFIYVIFATRPRHTESGALSAESPYVLHQTFSIVGAGGAMMLLSSPLVWLHYYVLLLPIVFYSIRPADELDSNADRETLRRTMGVSALVIFSPLARAIAEDLFNSQLLEAVLINAAAILLFAFALYELRHHRLMAVASVPVARSKAIAQRSLRRNR